MTSEYKIHICKAMVGKSSIKEKHTMTVKRARYYKLEANLE